MRNELNLNSRENYNRDRIRSRRLYGGLNAAIRLKDDDRILHWQTLIWNHLVSIGCNTCAKPTKEYR